MSCACKDCVSRARPTREAMTLIYGDADREIRAARLHRMLIIEAYDSDGDGGWDRDPEYGVAVSEPGFDALRELLVEDSPCEECGADAEVKDVQIGASMFSLCEGCRAKFEEADRRDEGPEYESDPLACPGCGGGCQVACR